jgi:anti-sigma regulatory factor (Ser/Thr protein kinase)
MGGAQQDDAEASGRGIGAGNMPGRFTKNESDPVVSALFLAEPESAPRARRSLEALRPLMSSSTFAAMRLLVSELVANGVEHSGAGQEQLIGLDVFAIAERVRVEVSDPGPGFDLPCVPSRQPWEAEYGRGLLIVDSVADSWGIAHGDRSAVWFELAVPGLVPA